MNGMRPCCLVDRRLNDAGIARRVRSGSTRGYLERSTAENRWEVIKEEEESKVKGIRTKRPASVNNTSTDRSQTLQVFSKQVEILLIPDQTKASTRKQNRGRKEQLVSVELRLSCPAAC